MQNLEKKAFFLPAIFLCISLLFSGCGKTEADQLSLGQANENPADTANTIEETPYIDL